MNVYIAVQCSIKGAVFTDLNLINFKTQDFLTIRFVSLKDYCQNGQEGNTRKVNEPTS